MADGGGNKIHPSLSDGKPQRGSQSVPLEELDATQAIVELRDRFRQGGCFLCKSTAHLHYRCPSAKKDRATIIWVGNALCDVEREVPLAREKHGPLSNNDTLLFLTREQDKQCLACRSRSHCLETGFGRICDRGTVEGLIKLS